MSEHTDKIRENRLRRMAERQRLRLEKSRLRDPLAYGYGTYQLIDIDHNFRVAGDDATGRGYGWSLDDVEDYLTRTGAWAR